MYRPLTPLRFFLGGGGGGGGSERQTIFFFECEHLFIDKPMVITEPAVASARLLGLGSKLYPSNIQGMLKKDLITQFMIQSPRVRQNRWQGGDG